MDWKRFESLIVAKLRAEFPAPGFRVEPDGREDYFIIGAKSGEKRQVDGAVFRAGDRHPFLFVDAKRYRTKLDLMDVERFLGFMPEIAPCIAVLISSSGFSEAAPKRVSDLRGVQLELVSERDALAADWLAEARRIFPYDWAFHPTICRSLRLLRAHADPPDTLEMMEGIPFEEWVALAGWALGHHRQEAVEFLEFVAQCHPDDAWRFNAAQQLAQAGLLAEAVRQHVVAAEPDADAREALQEM